MLTLGHRYSTITQDYRQNQSPSSEKLIGGVGFSISIEGNCCHSMEDVPYNGVPAPCRYEVQEGPSISLGWLDLFQ
jgi:hypothetical protein